MLSVNLRLTIACALLAAGSAKAQLTVSAVQPDSTLRECGWKPECSTPGAELTLNEFSREKVEGRTIVRYKLAAKGLPPGLAFTLWSDPADVEPEPFMKGYVTDSSGAVLCGDSTRESARFTESCSWCLGQNLGSVRLVAFSHSAGEPFSYALLATDSTVKAFAVVVPFPVEVSEGTCLLAAELAGTDPWLVHLKGRGFEPGETIQYSVKSDKETVSGTCQVSNHGTFQLSVLPAIQGKKGGKAEYKVQGSRCKLKLEYPWGDKLKPK